MHPSTFQPALEYRDKAIQKIDADIQSLMEQVRGLKSQRNTFTATYTLPAEILSKIFTNVQVQAKCKESTTKFVTDTTPELEEPFSVLQEWLVVTHVSQRWRSIALGCPALWWEISSNSLPGIAIQEFVRRSGEHTLLVDLEDALFSRLRFPNTDHLLSVIFAETFRIQNLRIANEMQFDAILPHTSGRPAPNLTELHISSSNEHTIDLLNETSLFNATTPRLTTLSLSNCQINLSSPLFGNELTTIDIYQCFAGSPTEWLATLRQIPHLSCLKLKWAFREAEHHHAISKDFGVVPLLQLSQLVICGLCLQSDLDFLAHITFPSHTEVEFSSRLRSTSSLPNAANVDESPFSAFLRVHSQSRCGSPWPGSQIESVKFEWIDRRRLVAFPGWGGEPPSPGDLLLVLRIGSKILLELLLCDLEASHVGEAHWGQIAESLPISTAKSFTTNVRGDHNTWRRFSSWFPDLRHVTIAGYSVSPCLAALKVDLRRDDTHDSAEDPGKDYSRSHLPLFTSLQSIYIHGEQESRFERALIKALDSRQEAGLPIKGIQFHPRFKLKDSLVVRMKDLVEEVHCNEHKDPQFGYCYYADDSADDSDSN